MAAHVDSGDTDAGMTSMCVFREGDYDGAYLCFPLYGVAIDAPDNSVVIADRKKYTVLHLFLVMENGLVVLDIVIDDWQQSVSTVNKRS